MVPRRRRGRPQAPRRRRQRRPRRLHAVLQGTLPQRAPPRPLRRGHHRPPQPRRMTETPRNEPPFKKTHPLVTGSRRRLITINIVASGLIVLGMALVAVKATATNIRPAVPFIVEGALIIIGGVAVYATRKQRSPRR